jgi:hypothetical protein
MKGSLGSNRLQSVIHFDFWHFVSLLLLLLLLFGLLLVKFSLAIFSLFSGGLVGSCFSFGFEFLLLLFLDLFFELSKLSVSCDLLEGEYLF